MNFLRTAFGFTLAFAILVAITIGAGLLFVPEPRGFPFVFVVGQIVLGEAILLLMILRSFGTADRGASGPSSLAQVGTYRLFVAAYVASLALTIAYFGWVRPQTPMDLAFYGIQLLVLGVPLALAIMSETTVRFMDQGVRADAAAKAEAGASIAKAVAALEDTVLWTSAQVRGKAAVGLQKLELAHRTLKRAVDAKIGLKGSTADAVGQDLDGVVGRLRRAVGEDRDLDVALTQAAEDLQRIAARL